MLLTTCASLTRQFKKVSKLFKAMEWPMLFNLRDLKYHRHYFIYLTFNLFSVKVTQALFVESFTST